MSWIPKQTEEIKKQLASLNKLLGGKLAQWNSQQPNMQGKRQRSTQGRPVCFKCKDVKAPKKEKPGGPAPKPKPASSLEQDFKKHIAAAKDMPALQQQQIALLAAQQQKREALPVQDQRTHLLRQARNLADKMDQQAKIAQEANRKRDQFREELVTVFGEAPKRDLPVPETPAATSSNGPGAPAQNPEALLATLAFTKSMAQDGNQEAQVIHEQMELSQEVEHMLENYDDVDSPGCTGDDQTGIEDTSMRDANEEPPKEDPAPDGDAEARKRIRAALEQGVGATRHQHHGKLPQAKS
eukprot:961711-Amphidinium_carterae.1